MKINLCNNIDNSDTDGEIDGITVDLSSIEGILNVVGANSLGQKMDMTDLVGGTDTSISADLAYAASGSNTYLSQSSVQGTIKADPLNSMFLVVHLIFSTVKTF